MRYVKLLHHLTLFNEANQYLIQLSKKMPVGIIQLQIYFPQVQSLKGKRHLIKPLINDLQKKFHVSVAETGKQDVWKNCELLIAVASSDAVQIEKIEQRLIEFIEHHWAETYITSNEMEIIFE